MLYLELSYRYAYVAALMGLVAIEVANDMLLAFNNLHLFTLCQPDALVALLPCGRCFCRRIGHHHSASYDKIILFAEAKDDARRFGPFCILGTGFPTEGVAVLYGEADAIGSDDFCLQLFVIEEYGIHVFCALAFKNQRLCLTQQLI